jgi:flagellar biosynthesis protein FlhG
MTDQAATLRVIRGGGGGKTARIVNRRAFAVSGGKGGVGKSTIALNLALAYANTGHRTLVLDTDLGMADLNLLLGVAPEKSMLDALGGTPIEDILVCAHGIKLLPALNGSYALSTTGGATHSRILDMVGSLSEKFDMLIVDVAAGIGRAQTTFAGATTDTIVVVNPEPLSMADAYACLKVLSIEQGVKHAFVVPNRITSRSQADEIVTRLRTIVDRFLSLELTALPPIPADPMVAESAQIGVPLMVHAPDSPAARAIRNLVRSLAALPPPARETWWRRPFVSAAEGDVR